MLEIREVQVLRGPSLWADVPLIRLVIDGEDPDDRSARLADRLVAAIPTLEEHPCGVGSGGEFLAHLRSRTPVRHIVEHLAVELQRIAGLDIPLHSVGSPHGSAAPHSMYPYHQEDVGLAAGRLAIRFLNHVIWGSEPEFDFDREARRAIVLLAERRAYGPSTAEIVTEAERRGIPVLRLDPDQSLVQLGHGRHQRRIWATRTSSTSGVAMDLASDKALTNRLLADVGIPSPRGVVARTEAQAERAAREIGYPVAVKPMDGNHGRGVCLDLHGAEAVRSAFLVARAESRSGAVVVERMIPGKDYRVLVVGGEVIAVAERVPAHVVGDGVHSVRQLVEIVNADPRRGLGHERPLTRIVIDNQTRDLLAAAGLETSSVPAPGVVVQLKRTANMSTGGTAIDRTDEIHPDNIEISREAAMVVGLDVAGIDFITPDISRSVHEASGAIVEVNAAPGFRMHTHPTEGLPRQVGRAVMDTLFPPGAPSRIPIVAVTGTNGKTTTTRMIAHILQSSGQTAGMTTSDGIYVSGTQIAAGDMAGPESARMILKNPRVDVAVLETARGGILRSGLGFDRCNVAVVTNVASDHLGMKGIDTLEDLARVKAVVPASVRRDGASVLNADCELTVGMGKLARGEIIYFSMNERSPVVREHVRQNGRAVVLRETAAGGMLTLVERRRETEILLARDIPATLNERVRVNVANALAATAAAIGANVSIACIRASLKTFSTAFSQTPGRFNLVVIEGKQVVVDYCHNVDGLRWIADFVHRTLAPQAIGVIAIAGDRRDEDIRAFGELAGRVFDRIVIREHDDRRGRAPGEVAGMLRQAAIAGGMPPERATVIIDEIEAVHTAIDLAAPGDLVVAMVYRIPRVWESLLARQQDNRVMRPLDFNSGGERFPIELGKAPA